MKNSPFTRVEDFGPKEVLSAFITLAKDGAAAQDDNGDFYEFIRENSEYFPGIYVENNNAMNHANGLCKEVWSMNELTIEETNAS